MNQLWYDPGVLPRTYEDQVCSVARGLSVIGDRWTLLIVRDAFQGLTTRGRSFVAAGVAVLVAAAVLPVSRS